jgi:hypothetical protein
VGSAPEIEACVPPRGQKRNFGCTPGWSSNPSSEGSAKPEEQIKADLDEYDTNVDDGIKSHVNLGFGSKTVGPFSPRVKNSISDWDVFGLASPILGKRSRTEVETPLSKLPLVLSPSPLLFTQTDEGDSVHGGGARSAFRGHVRVPNPLHTASRYPRTPSRPELKRSSPSRSHTGLPSCAVVMGAVDMTGGMNARSPGRGGVGGLRKVPGEERHVEFRLSPADVQSHLDEDEPPAAVTVEVGTNDLNNPSPGSFPSDPGIRSCSSTADSLSPRTEVLFSSNDSEVTSCALRRRSRQDGQNGIATGEMKMDAGERGDRLGGVGSMHGYHQTRQLPVIPADGPDDGDKFDCGGLGSVLDRVERLSRTDVSQGRDASGSRCYGSRCYSHSCSTHGLCTDADVESVSRGPPVGSCFAIPPRSRYRYSGLSSDRGFVFGSHPRRHVEGRTVDARSPGSRSYSRIRHQTPTSSSFKAFVPSFSSTPLEEVPYTYDPRVFHDNTELNTRGNSPWFIQTHEHVHANTREFDTLRFSSSSPSASIAGSASPSVSAPSNPLLDDRDKLDENTDSEAGGSGPGFIGRPLNRELRSHMMADMTSDSSTRTGLNGDADWALLNYTPRGRPSASFINNLGGNEGDVSRHVAGVEQRDMGGLDHESLGPLDRRGRASPVSASPSGSVSRVSGIFAASSLFPPALGTRPHSDEEDTWLPASLGSGRTSIQPRSIDRGEEEELEECGLLRSLLESSDPWSLMRKKVLNLPSPTPSEVERRSKREQEDMVIVRGSLGRRGVGYVTPPSMEALLGVVDPDGGVEVEDAEEGSGGDEDSQEILDFQSSQPCTALFSISVGQAG